jgi:hypothetical protein
MVLTGLTGEARPGAEPRDIHLILEISQEEKPTFFRACRGCGDRQFPDVQFDLKSVKACVGAAPCRRSRGGSRKSRRRRADQGTSRSAAGDP